MDDEERRHRRQHRCCAYAEPFAWPFRPPENWVGVPVHGGTGCAP